MMSPVYLPAGAASKKQTGATATADVLEHMRDLSGRLVQSMRETFQDLCCMRQGDGELVDREIIAMLTAACTAKQVPVRAIP